MAADLNPDWLSCLPSSWSYGVTRDGRVFFINEEAKSTTWLHPVTGEAVITGHRKTPDLPTGWEEGYTFEGARCFINHNERKVTCKHPVSAAPSQDNCIFVVNEHLNCGKLVHAVSSRPVSKAAADEKKERPMSTMSEASNYTGGSDYTAPPCSPTARPSRSSKKVHNFGKRSNSIKRNPNAPVVKSNWLYKQDSTGMKMWKKRWFVLSDMCLFYYRDEKEEGILGSILLPSFHISMLSVDDHISRKYAFKAAHPNMRTYYFSTDTAKEMESWMRVMTDAALVHMEPIRRLEKVKTDLRSPQDMNNMLNHRVLTRPEIQNNERNRESFRQEDKKQKQVEKQSSTHRTMLSEKHLLQKDGDRYTLQKDGEKYLLQRDGQNYKDKKCPRQKDSEKYIVQKDGEQNLHKDGSQTTPRERTRTAPAREPEEPAVQREVDRYGFQETTERPLTKINSIKLQPAQAAAIATAISSARQLPRGVPQQAGQLNGSEDDSPGGVSINLPPGGVSSTLPPGGMSNTLPLGLSESVQRREQWARTQRTLEDETRSITSYQTLPRNMPSHRTPVAPRFPEGYRTLPRNMLRPGSVCSVAGSVYDRALPSAATATEKRRSLRDDTMWQLYEWQQRQTHSRLGYGTLPSPKTMGRIAESIPCSPSHGTLPLYHSASPNRPYNPATSSEVSSPVFRGDVSLDRRRRAPLPKYAFPPERRVPVTQSVTPQSLQGKTPEELTLLLIKLRRQQAELHSVREHTLAQLGQLNADTTHPKSEILSHHLQRNLMYVDSQIKENEPIIFLIHTMIENSAPRPQLYQQMNPEGFRENVYSCRPEELDVDAKLSRLCEQGKVVRTQEDKLQQLHREKHTLETALLSASQEIEMNAENPGAVQSVIQQRDVLQSGLLSTCRELSRVTTELDRSWREYDKLEIDVTLAKRNLLEQLEALGSPQTEPPSHQHVQIQKELWRIQDVMEALNKNKNKRNAEPSFPGANPLSSLQKSEETGCVPPRPPLPQLYEGGERPGVPPQSCPSSTQPHPTPHRPEERKTAQRNGSHSGPDYRLYKSEPELTTVAEVDESNGEEKSEHAVEKESCVTKGVSFPVGVVSPRKTCPLPESSTIASYVTLRKSKKPDSRTVKSDRPCSAVEQMSGGEGIRQRMSVEEQMERIRRHQQGAVRERERKREECLLSHSQSFSKDNPSYYTLQVTCTKSSALSQEEQGGRRRQMSVCEAELMRVKEPVATQEVLSMGGPDLELQDQRSTASREPEPQGQIEPAAERLADSLQTAVMVQEGTQDEGEQNQVSGQGHDDIIKTSCDVAASKHGNLVSVNSVSSAPHPPSPPHLPDGSHFMCV
ncbi:pleckstrin homology domain-containing family A member 5 isoform X5 [Brachyhypopomus gauderio]|uniref:pleckstrin homology domain-containing family A member 5 isoform X5 n=1 Tax=Brachyhypopomus gauderio TaxID=698409 RepID=UPI0040433DA3